MIYFPETIIQWGTILIMVILYNCCTMHNNTHSVHKSLLKLCGFRLPSRWPCCNVPSPPLSGANCCPFPFSGGPGPPVPKMALLSPGSTHTPSPLSVSISKPQERNYIFYLEMSLMFTLTLLPLGKVKVDLFDFYIKLWVLLLCSIWKKYLFLQKRLPILLEFITGY